MIPAMGNCWTSYPLLSTPDAIEEALCVVLKPSMLYRGINLHHWLQVPNYQRIIPSSSSTLDHSLPPWQT